MVAFEVRRSGVGCCLSIPTVDIRQGAAALEQASSLRGRAGLWHLAGLSTLLCFAMRPLRSRRWNGCQRAVYKEGLATSAVSTQICFVNIHLRSGNVLLVFVKKLMLAFILEAQCFLVLLEKSIHYGFWRGITNLTQCGIDLIKISLHLN